MADIRGSHASATTVALLRQIEQNTRINEAMARTLRQIRFGIHVIADQMAHVSELPDDEE